MIFLSPIFLHYLHIRLGKIDEWDVINEAITNNDFRRNTWYDIVSTQENDDGEVGFQSYFAHLFKWARQADTAAELFYNDYNIEPFWDFQK